ncbi:MAG: iron ABC transporter permease, partial [Peptococcaceae bacterium]|nr:iron ABC transporter permease [Peptococcaceae bacterium]
MGQKKFRLDVSSTRIRRILFYLTLIVLPVLAGVICLCIGRFSTTPAETLSALGRILTQGVEQGDNLAKIIRDMRLPRIAMAILVGGGLSVAGLAFQSLFANPMASPDTLGVAAGASFGAVLALLFGAGTLATQFAALLMGFVAVGLTLSIGKGKGSERSLTSMILGGMVISSLFSALISLVKLVADTDSKLPAITYWLMGSLNSATWYTVLFALPFVLGGIALLFSIRWRLNILPMSEDEIQATGSNV